MAAGAASAAECGARCLDNGNENGMEFGELSAELKKKFEACETPEEVLALVKQEGLELSDEELEGIAGGGIWHDAHSDGCPSCGSTNISYSNVGQWMYYKCKDCGKEWC